MTSPTPTLTDEQAVFAEMTRLDPGWNAFGRSRESAVRFALRAVAILAANEAAPAAAAEGWKLVPLEPTPRMLFEADKILGGEPRILAALYRAMVAASSSVEGVGSEAELERQRLFYPKVGQQCVFDARGGWPYEQESAKKALALEGIYTVAKVEVRSAHTRVWLVGKGEGYGDWFNSMMFRPAAPASPSPAGPSYDSLVKTAASLRAALANPPPDIQELVLRKLGMWPPAGQSEPVAEVLSWTNSSYGRNYKLRWLKDVPEGSKLYAASPAGVQGYGEAIVEAIARQLDGCMLPMFDVYGNLTTRIDIGAAIREAGVPALPAGRAGAEGGETQ